MNQPMGKKVEWKWRRKQTSDATTNIDLKSDQVLPGWKRTVQRTAVEDETTACTEVRIGIITMTDIISWFAEQESNQAGVLYWEKDPVVLEAGDRLLVRFTGSSDGDVLAVYAYGYEERVED